jgi:hypothetical protein
MNPFDDEREYRNEDEEARRAGMAVAREGRRPPIDHLENGTVAYGTTVLPLFNIGDRVVIERRTDWVKGTPWLDTDVYDVKDIDDETGNVSVMDDLWHAHVMNYRNPLHVFKLVPPGCHDPFRVPVHKLMLSCATECTTEAPTLTREATPDAGQGKPRGRPKGSRSRPREAIVMEREERRRMRMERKGR